eukprot:CAMPEP_0179061914 /NCGR_PEP_ID=MMETSP0796-20121207/26662_1 /TAXON_ID=73915 /ORGANISM="Pyrodinium bahamense, Strain pbaha01" /LENGTH=54 /DNA_ID=CAMNT_0020758813 /DNA_START=143 /DNA_END=303 /DNA_ORIENTATION=+
MAMHQTEHSLKQARSQSNAASVVLDAAAQGKASRVWPKGVHAFQHERAPGGGMP